jgi:hypothetical protein
MEWLYFLVPIFGVVFFFGLMVRFFFGKPTKPTDPNDQDWD